VVIDDLNVARIRIHPSEANPPLIVDPNAVLTFSVTGEGFETIRWNDSQIGERRCRMELVQFPLRYPSDTLVFPAELTPEDSFGLLVTERPNHDSRILLHRVKCNAGSSFSLKFVESLVLGTTFDVYGIPGGPLLSDSTIARAHNRRPLSAKMRKHSIAASW